MVDVAADNPIQIAPTDHETHCYTTFIYAFSIIGDPDNGVSDAWVDTQRAKECASVLYGSRFAGHEHSEADDTDYAGADIAEAALTRSVGYVTDCDCENRGGRIGRNREKLGGR